MVTVSPGPLIRVEGQSVSIRCDVNDYGGPREQVSVLYTLISQSIITIFSTKYFSIDILMMTIDTKYEHNGISDQ